jgi:enterochelin esterase family protein
MPAIQRFLATKPDAAAALAWVRGRTFPIVEGSQVTVVWVGEPEAVRLRHWIFGLETSTSLERVPGTPLWYLTIEIPRGSRVEYKLEVDEGGRRRLAEDPLNPNRANDPFGHNSVILGDGYVTPAWTQHDPTARAGYVEPFRFESRTFGERGGHIYTPARFRRSRNYPLLVVHDGSDYLRYADLKNVLDNLIHRLEIPDLIVVCTDSPDRLREYANDERHARFVVEELLPWAEARFPLVGTPASRCLMGASFGAVASLSTAVRYPGAFGRLLLQSGSFAFSDIGRANRRGPAFEPIIPFMNAFRADPQPVSQRVYMSCGVYESLIYENRSLQPLLAATGMQVRFEEARDGHNWDNWRDRLRTGLSYLFPGPLLFVYE